MSKKPTSVKQVKPVSAPKPIRRWDIVHMWAAGQSDNYYQVVDLELKGGFVHFQYRGEPRYISGNIKIRPANAHDRDKAF